MRKFLIPVINLINLILVSITFGLAYNTAAYDVLGGDGNVAMGNWYQMVWTGSIGNKVNLLGIVGFFLFVVACALVLVTFFPSKVRKFILVLTGLMFVGAGVLMLLTPNGIVDSFSGKLETIDRSGSLIAMAVLVFCAGGLSLGAAALDFTSKKVD